MYCVKCGVELADSENKCPLCQTPVYFPNREELREGPYPKSEREKEEISPRGIYFILIGLFAIAAIISLVIDLNIHRAITFSGYVVGSLVVLYVMFILPGWFRRPSPAVFAPCSFLAIGLFVLYVNCHLGGDWFLSFALPVTGAFALIICATLILRYYIRKGLLYIYGGTSIALGVFCVFVEILIHKNFGVHDYLAWSAYPFITLFLIGIMLIVIAIVRPFRESLKKIFLL